MDGEKEVKGKLSIILDHICYILHPTFPEPRREEPYVLEEKGWGEFDMRIVLYFTDNLTDPRKAKPETKSKPEKHPKKTYSPSPIPRSPSFNNLSPAPNSISTSSPAYSHITTATPESNNDEKIVSPENNLIQDEGEHAYTLRDVYNLDSIHRAKIDEETRERWGIPEINMMELAKRIYRMPEEQCEELQQIIIDNQTDDMQMISDPDGGVGIDLYSLGPSLLEKIWDFSADMISDDNQSFTSQDAHASDLELDSDMEQGEYNSDDDGEIRTTYDDPQITDDDVHTEREEGEESDYNRYGSGAYEPTGYREIGEFHYTPDHNNIIQNSGADEPSFHFSDNESTNGEQLTSNHLTNGYMNNHMTNGGYHETSDMDVQDDDDY
ncbi:hypothetical protein HPULCUR_004954 [Helicostylum pulchrum]|uniref:YEATS domain-containing protein n=1 Tax=Helicostylum pulchrum TaxID=562976 RepID=A0ABP9XZ44_9FUNG